jgi:hypothetical protein
MAGVLTTSSEVLCDTAAPKLHGGKVQLSSGAKLKVAGAPVVTKAGVGPSLAQPCSTAPPPTGNKPCTTATVASGEATKLKAGGSPVMLDTIAGSTDGVPPGKLPGKANQTKLKAV